MLARRQGRTLVCAFANAVRLHGGMNPVFFEGTVVEDEARAILEQGD